MSSKKKVKKRGNGNKSGNGGGKTRQRNVGAVVQRSQIIAPNFPLTNRTAAFNVSHTEMCCSISNQVEAVAHSYLINPKNDEIFPWLSTLAHCFETYEFRKLNFFYRPTCPTNYGGSVSMAIDWDWDDERDPVPNERRILMTYKGAVSGNVWDGLELRSAPLELKSNYRRLFTSIHQAADSTLGRLIVWTEGAIETKQVGDLWVDYDITFYTPQIDTDVEEYRAEISNTGPTSNTLANASLPMTIVTEHGSNFCTISRDENIFRLTFNDLGPFLVQLAASCAGTYFDNSANYVTAADDSMGQVVDDWLPDINGSAVVESLASTYRVLASAPAQSLLIYLGTKLAYGTADYARVRVTRLPKLEL
jgi:hypothetical protein